MSYYDSASTWSGSGRQASWEQPPPPSRSGTNSAVQREEFAAFSSQFEEVERASDNLLKSGKMYAGMPPPGRRDSLPTMSGGARAFEARLGGGPQRHHSVSDYENARPPQASNLQGYYANQRFGPRGAGEPDQMMQAKRRMAAQRERELRNYHQEQQYNRNVSSSKSDRSMSPKIMSEEDRRELIARQRRALYGDDSGLYANDDATSRPTGQDVRVPATNAGLRGSSPLAFDPFGLQGQGASGDSAVQMPSRDQMSGKDAPTGNQRSRANSTSSPSSNPTTSFNLFDNAQQANRTSASSPGGSPPVQGGTKVPSGQGVAPIGTRPSQAQGQAGSNKRSTTPLPSPLSFGYTANDAANNNGGNNNNNNERSTSASSNPSSSVADKGVSLGWGNNSGVWSSSKNTLGVQASVWG